jgi:hypothetical protein
MLGMELLRILHANAATPTSIYTVRLSDAERRSLRRQLMLFAEV